MGLSSTQVSGRDRHGWSRSLVQAQKLELPNMTTGTAASILMKRLLPENSEQRQVQEAEKCPRCESPNTKFCYYNNYNKSQPRYFCRTCKRHWTKGGTLRNVPVGGARKNNKRLKTKTASTNTTSTDTSTSRAAVSSQQQQKQKQVAARFSSDGHQPLIDHTTSSSLLSEIGRSPAGMNNSNTSIACLISSSFCTTPSSISTSLVQQLSNGFGYAGDHSSTITEQRPTSSQAPWHTAACSTLMDDNIMSLTAPASSYWNYWDDIETFVSTWDHIDSDHINIKQNLSR